MVSGGSCGLGHLAPRVWGKRKEDGTSRVLGLGFRV